MSSISTNDVIIGVKTAATWGTAVSVAGGYSLRASAMTISGGFGTFLPRDIGLAALLSDVKQLNGNFNISITCDVTFNQAWQHLSAMVLGQENAQAETTGGQGDYCHPVFTVGSTTGKFSTIAWLVEDDRALEIPSVKWTSVTLSVAAQDVGTFTFNGICDQIRLASTNSVAILNALSPLTYESGVFGGANAYCRISSYGTAAGQALSATHDKQVAALELSVSRAFTPRFALRGANSKYTLEPFQTGPVEATLAVQISETDDAIRDLFDDWLGQSQLQAEFYLDGAAIASGVNRSIKVRVPYMKARGEVPTGYDVANNNSMMAPRLVFQCLSASAAPSAMGFGNPVILSTVDTLAAKWT